MPSASDTSWLELSTLADAEAVESLAELFSEWGQGVAIEEPVVSSPDGEQVSIDRERPVFVKTYLPLDERTEERRRKLEEGAWHLGQLRSVEPLTVRTIHESEWEEAWKRHFHVQRIGQRLAIVPSWRPYRKRRGELPIYLDPGMAFGTGLHPTTRLCLRALEQHVTAGMSVLDLGCGSGILSIAAALLGAASVLGLDVDSTAARVARENAGRNSVADTVRVEHGSLPDEREALGPFDVVVANISFRVLSALRAEIASILKPDGVALLSGVLQEDAPRLMALLEEAGWSLAERHAEGDWIILAVLPPRL
ncbi:MAG: 50S ribosomal protein L11 methyltransferase [Chloroflexi bacterium]|nr:50S ribosomal protein L11 methyltransferase [Chloroflexota bacterium]